MKKKYSNIVLTLLLLSFVCGCREDSDIITGGNISGSAKTTSGHIVIIAPSLGEVWKPGTENSIRWTSTGGITKINIELFRKTEMRGTLAASIPNNGLLLWTIAPDILKSVHYSVKISNAENAAQFTFSNTFAIK